ncbi:MAG: zinc ribbon domain-containing protein [Bifidobacterium sp.]|nr:zinc ribbon domain-containing protein [Bifidobacterium sp.]
MAMTQCPNCGTHISKVARRCAYCGFEAPDAARPIAEQCTFEPVPLVQRDMEPLDLGTPIPLHLSPDDNRRLFELLTDWDWLLQMAPDLAEFIRQMTERTDTGMVAKLKESTRKLVDEGILQFQLDRDGNLLPQVVDGNNRIVEKVRLEQMQAVPNLTLVLQHMQTQAAIAMVLTEIRNVEHSLEQMQVEIQQDRLAKADAAWALLMQATSVTDTRRRDRMLDQVLQMTTDAKHTLMRNYAQKWRALQDPKYRNRHRAALDAFEDLVAITNMVHVETEAYALAGEPEAQLYCLHGFREFIVENRLDERDTLLEINSRIKATNKQPQLVDQLETLGKQVVELDDRTCLGATLDPRMLEPVLTYDHQEEMTIHAD